MFPLNNALRKNVSGNNFQSRGGGGGRSDPNPLVYVCVCLCMFFVSERIPNHLAVHATYINISANTDDVTTRLCY